MKIRIALCDNDPKALSVVAGAAESVFRDHGFHARMDRYLNCETLLQALDAEQYQMVLLDIDMPGIDGIQAAKQIREKHVDVILSHTCPLKYEPLEMFLPGIDQSRVDRSTEQWLDSIEEALAYHAWLCGHWHINKRTHRMHFLFHGFTSSEELKKIISGEIPGDV